MNGGMMKMVDGMRGMDGMKDGAACKATCTILNDEILFGQFLA